MTQHVRDESPAAQVLAFAREKSKTAGDWMELHNAVFGIGGKAGELFPTRSQRESLLESEEYKEIILLMHG